MIRSIWSETKMSVPDRSIDPRLLSAAKDEFLKNGYEAASLTEICSNAGVTTGALYKRFSGKEDLFSALVADTIRDMEDYALTIEKSDISALSDKELYDSFSLLPGANRSWLRFLYERREKLTLLIRCSAGTKYGSFHHDWADKMNRLDYKFYQEAQRRGMTSKEISIDELHVLTYSVWGLFYEPFFYDFTWEQLETHAEIITDFINWHKALGITEPAAE